MKTKTTDAIDKESMDKERSPPATFVIYPDDDLPKTWIGHCPEVNVVTQGHSPEHALEVLQEAVTMVIYDDVARGADPTERRARIRIPARRMTPSEVDRWIDRFDRSTKDLAV